MAKKRKPEPNRSRSRTKPTIEPAPTPSDLTPYFHGGAPGLKPGGVLRPAAALGYNFNYHLKDAVYDPEYVYFTPKVEIATAFASRCVLPPVGEVPGDVYRVQPLGDVEPDPDFEPFPDIYLRAPRARILEVVRAKVVLTDREARQLEAPWSHWGTPDQPMYDRDGFMIPSEQMKSYGVTAEHTRIYGPWLSWDRISPGGLYRPTKAAKRDGARGIAAELLEQVPGLDAPHHQVSVKGSYAAKGPGISYRCICGFHRRGPDGPSPAEHQLGEHLVGLIKVGWTRSQTRLIESLAQAAALRSPERWRWFTPTPF